MAFRIQNRVVDSSSLKDGAYIHLGSSGCRWLGVLSSSANSDGWEACTWGKEALGAFWSWQAFVSNCQRLASDSFIDLHKGSSGGYRKHRAVACYCFLGPIEHALLSICKLAIFFHKAGQTSVPLSAFRFFTTCIGSWF